MPSKPTTKPPTMADPMAGLLGAADTMVADPPVGPPPAPDEPYEGDDDDEEEDETPQPQPTPPTASRTSRRGFLGAVAGLAGGAAAGAVLPSAPEAPAPVAAAVGGMTPELQALASFFVQEMDRRDRVTLDELDRRLSAIRAELPVPNGVAHAASPAELAARPGEYPPSMQYARPTGAPTWPAVDGSRPRAAEAPPTALQQQRMVAFIPKEDPYNPRHTTFRGWVNGRELRGKRGQIMIVHLGTGVDWARNGHGNCVDIAAMQGVGSPEPIAVPQAPNYARPDTWDGLPMNNRSSFMPGAALPGYA